MFFNRNTFHHSYFIILIRNSIQLFLFLSMQATVAPLFILMHACISTHPSIHPCIHPTNQLLINQLTNQPILATFQVLRAHHVLKGLVGSWHAPLKVNNTADIALPSTSKDQ